jgi:hypothetical protein
MSKFTTPRGFFESSFPIQLFHLRIPCHIDAYNICHGLMRTCPREMQSVLENMMKKVGTIVPRALSHKPASCSACALATRHPTAYKKLWADCFVFCCWYFVTVHIQFGLYTHNGQEPRVSLSPMGIVALSPACIHRGGSPSSPFTNRQWGLFNQASRRCSTRQLCGPSFKDKSSHPRT